MKQFIISMYILFLCVLTGCVSTSNNRKSSDAQNDYIVEKRGDYEDIIVDEYIVHNNVWGKQSIQNYKQSVFLKDADGESKMGWKWNWPITNRVVGYPEIMYGANPWYKSLTDDFPRLLTDDDIIVDYEVKMESTGIHNLAFDIWVNRGEKPTTENITHEIMIWMYNKKMIPGGTKKSDVVIDGEGYELFIWDDVSLGQPSGTRTYIAFVAHKPKFIHTINIGKFMEYLLINNYVTVDLYIAGIEFGTEIVGGTGEIVFMNYKVKVP